MSIQVGVLKLLDLGSSPHFLSVCPKTMGLGIIEIILQTISICLVLICLHLKKVVPSPIEALILLNSGVTPLSLRASPHLHLVIGHILTFTLLSGVVGRCGYLVARPVIHIDCLVGVFLDVLIHLGWVTISRADVIILNHDPSKIVAVPLSPGASVAIKAVGACPVP